MISFIKTIIYIPLYNLLILILNIPFVDAGIATVILTVFVKMILYPLAKKSIVTQIVMKQKAPEIALIKTKYKDKQEQALKTMEFYKENNINPFSSIITLFLQIPIIYSLYHIFLKSGLPEISTDMLYSFIKIPEVVSMNFLGLIDISEKSLLLALLAAVSSYVQMHVASPDLGKSASNLNTPPDLSQMMTKQMKYTMPVIVFFISWQISGVVALYWFVSNLVSIGQDMYVKRQFKQKLA